MNKLKRITYFFIIMLMSYGSVFSQPRMAPEWVISEWINGTGVSLSDLKGKVVIVEFFQLWCPGCNRFSIPLMKKWNRTFKKEIHHLVGIDTHKNGESMPETMKRYKTKGTPEIAIIDKDGNIFLQIFGGFDTDIVERDIRQLILSK